MSRSDWAFQSILLCVRVFEGETTGVLIDSGGHWMGCLPFGLAAGVGITSGATFDLGDWLRRLPLPPGFDALTLSFCPEGATGALLLLLLALDLLRD